MPAAVTLRKSPGFVVVLWKAVVSLRAAADAVPALQGTDRLWGRESKRIVV